MGLVYASKKIVSYCRWVPVFVDQEQQLGVMSIAFLLNSKEDAVVWRGPKKNGKLFRTFNFKSRTITIYTRMFIYYHINFFFSLIRSPIMLVI